MGKPGPKPKNKRLDDLDGNPGKRPPKPDPIEATGTPTPPAWLGAYALKIWADVIGSMPPGFYATADAILLATYCQACDMAKRASEDIEEHGIILINAQKNKTRNPASQVLSDAMAKIVTIGNHLGLDPAARQALGITAAVNPEGKKKKASGFGDLIPIKGGKAS